MYVLIEHLGLFHVVLCSTIKSNWLAKTSNVFVCNTKSTIFNTQYLLTFTEKFSGVEDGITAFQKQFQVCALSFPPFLPPSLPPSLCRVDLYL